MNPYKISDEQFKQSSKLQKHLPRPNLNFKEAIYGLFAGVTATCPIERNTVIDLLFSLQDNTVKFGLHRLQTLPPKELEAALAAIYYLSLGHDIEEVLDNENNLSSIIDHLTNSQQIEEEALN